MNSDIFYGIDTIIISVISGAWIYYKFRKERFLSDKIEIGFSDIQYSSNSNILKITFFIKNIGNNVVIPNEDESLLEIINIKKLECTNSFILNWKDFENVVPPIHIFKTEEYKTNVYLIEPGVTDYIDVLIYYCASNLIFLKLKFVEKKGYTWYRNEILDVKNSNKNISN